MFFYFYNILKKIKQLLIVLLPCIILYTINNFTKNNIICIPIKIFMCSYFNDILAGIYFPVIMNIILPLNKPLFKNIWAIESLLFICGLFWEYVAPFLKPTATTDKLDIVAYMFGGLIFWSITKLSDKYRHNILHNSIY